MKAWVLHDIGDIQFNEKEIPVPKENEVLIKVMAAGICGSDIPRIYDTGTHNMPLVPGHEFAGMVEGIGKNVPSSWMGKRVAVYPRIACGSCKECLGGRYDRCMDYDYIGSRRDGAFAEYVTVPQMNLLPLPASVSFEEGAMLEPMAVAANAVRRFMGMPVTKDRPVAVCGLGPIGLMVVTFLKEAGYKDVFVIGNKDVHRERAEALGVPAERYYDSCAGNAAELIRKDTDGGAAAYFECVGKNECIVCGLEITSPGGQVILVGNPYSDMIISRDAYWQILRKQLTVSGIWNSSFLQEALPDGSPDDWHYVLQRLTNGEINPKTLISHRLGLEGLEQGIVMMRDRIGDYCKAMMVMK